MSMYDQRKRNEILRDVRDGEAARNDGPYEFLLSVPMLVAAAAVMIYCFVEGFLR